MVEDGDGFVNVEPLDMAGQTLERAADIAEKMNDVQAMMKVAAGWMEIHEYLRGTAAEERSKRKPRIGFCGPSELEEELDDAVGEYVEPEPDDEPEYDDDDEYAAEGDS